MASSWFSLHATIKMMHGPINIRFNTSMLLPSFLAFHCVFIHQVGKLNVLWNTADFINTDWLSFGKIQFQVNPEYTLLLKAEKPVFAYAYPHRKASLQIHIMYLGNKKIYCILKTCCIISVLFTTKCHLLHTFYLFCSNNNHAFHKPFVKI